jgi:hypothetical protein
MNRSEGTGPLDPAQHGIGRREFVAGASRLSHRETGCNKNQDCREDRMDMGA